MEFIYHDGIQREIAALTRRFHKITDDFKTFERLCEVQFHPERPRAVIAPAKLHRITQNEVWTLWKIELVLRNSGLRPNQYPRMWFAVKGSIVGLLCIASHIDNYDDIKMDKLALSRATDIF